MTQWYRGFSLPEWLNKLKFQSYRNFTRCTASNCCRLTVPQVMAPNLWTEHYKVYSALFWQFLITTRWRPTQTMVKSNLTSRRVVSTWQVWLLRYSNKDRLKWKKRQKQQTNNVVFFWQGRCQKVPTRLHNKLFALLFIKLPTFFFMTGIWMGKGISIKLGLSLDFLWIDF